MVFPSRVKYIALLILFVSVLSCANATVVIANARDWRITYLLGFYAPMKEYNFMSIDTRATGEEVIPYLIPKGEEIIVYESDDPVIPNYEGALRARGFQKVRTVRVHDPYDLMFDLPREWAIETRGYVIVSDSAGEWVLAAGPLAYRKHYMVLFLSNKSIDRILARVPSDAPIYVIGYQGRRVREAFPNAVYISTGNKARDSIEIAKEMNKDAPISEVLVLSGMFLYSPAHPAEIPIWTGFEGRTPIIITYVEGMPSFVEEFLSLPQIREIKFIGPEFDPDRSPELKSQFEKLRTRYGGKKTLVVLCGVGYINVPTRVPGQQYPPPAFLLPSAEVLIVPESVDALAQGILYIRLRNQGKAAGYATITYVELNCGDVHMELRPSTTVFIDAGDSVLVDYNLGTVLPQVNCGVYVEEYYGPDADRAVDERNATFTIIPQAINDQSSVDVTRVMYSPRLERFVIYVKNTGNVRAYVTAYLKGVLIDGVATDLKSRQVAVAPGADAKLYAKAYLTDADILDNPSVHVVLRFGEQPNLPVKMVSKDLPLEKETLTDVVIEFVEENAPLIAVLLLILVIVAVLLLRR